MHNNSLHRTVQEKKKEFLFTDKRGDRSKKLKRSLHLEWAETHLRSHSTQNPEVDRTGSEGRRNRLAGRFFFCLNSNRSLRMYWAEEFPVATVKCTVPPCVTFTQCVYSEPCVFKFRWIPRQHGSAPKFDPRKSGEWWMMCFWSKC